MKSKGIAYLLWAIGGFGALGFHRFYIEKIGTGLIWLVTARLFWSWGIDRLVYVSRSGRCI